MAVNKTIGAYGSKGHKHYFKLSLNETKTSLEYNNSTISYTFNLSEESGYYFDWDGHGSKISYTITINNTKITGTIPSYTPSTGGTNLKTGTIVVPHNEDGSKKISFSFVVSDNTGASYTCGNAQASGELELTKILRASLIDIIPLYNVEKDLSVPIIKYVSSYYDVLEIYNSDETEVLATVENIQNKDNINLLNLLGADKLYTLMIYQDYKFIFVIKSYSDSTKTKKIGQNSRNTIGFLSAATSSPIFIDFDIEDSNDTTYALTQNRNIFIKGYSTLKISNLNATAQKKAVISYWIVNNNSIANTGNNVIKIENYNTNSVTVYAQDNRKFSTPLTKTITNFVEYFKLTKGNQNIERVDNVNEETNISFEGDMWVGNFGSVSNELQVTYQYKQTKDNNWIDGTGTITPTVQNNKYSFNGLILGDTNNGFNIGNSYDIKIIVKDKLSQAEFNYQLQSGKPAIAIYQNMVALGDKFDESLESNVQLWGNVLLNGNQIIVNNIYSEDEMVIGKWIGNKPIYRKVIVTTNALNTTTVTINHNIENFEHIVNCYGYAPFGTSQYLFGAVEENKYINIASVDASTFKIKVAESWLNSFTEGCVTILEYTKNN